jgi:hypothetical protein
MYVLCCACFMMTDFSVFHFAIQKYKDENIHNYNVASCFVCG